MKKVLVTGANGQLGMSLRDIAGEFGGLSFDFKSSNELDITSGQSIKQAFESSQYDFCINCAAYTAVDKAEEEENEALRINFEGVKLLAEACKKYEVVLVHISTDFVFDGNQKESYTEEDQTNPLNVYGRSKLLGENILSKTLDEHYIVRTSWVYSEYGNNFVKTMLRLAATRSSLQVINDQIGSPTYARDLAYFLVQLISREKAEYGLYHFNNDAEISWYDFAVEIFRITELNNHVSVNPISYKEYPSPTVRPNYSALSNEKRVALFGQVFTSWKESLRTCLSEISLKK